MDPTGEDDEVEPPNDEAKGIDEKLSSDDDESETEIKSSESPEKSSPTSAPSMVSSFTPSSDSPSSGQAPGASAATFKCPLAFKFPAFQPKQIKPKEVESKETETEEKPKEETKAKQHEPNKKSPLDSWTPAQKKQYSSVPMPYKEPSWSGIPDIPYHLEVLKMGKIVDTLNLAKPFFVFGRLPTCDVPLEHPSLSRFHAILQFRASDEAPDCPDDKKKGFYLMDLGSTHGTFLNKSQVEANTFIRIKAGHMFKFGGSSRYFILQGGSLNDEEAESDLSLTQLKELRKVREEHLRRKVAEEEERDKKEKERESKGASWGFADDAEEDDSDDDDDDRIDMSKNPYAGMAGKAEHEDHYADDPRKCLQNWFEREGEDLEYEFVEEGTGKKKNYFCRMTLPIDSEEPVVAEGQGQKKKEAKIVCALEACKILDMRGLLFQSHQESQAERKRKKLEENDFYDSDEDEFLDRTGEIEAKRRKRMALMGKAEEEKALTFDELEAKLNQCQDECLDIERKLEMAKKEADDKKNMGEDSLDAFMSSIKSGRTLDTKTRIKMKMRLQDLKKEQVKLQRLADIARPASLPPLQRQAIGHLQKRAGVWVGKMGGRGGGGMRNMLPLAPSVVKERQDKEEEEEEEEDEEEEEENMEKKEKEIVSQSDSKTDQEFEKMEDSQEKQFKKPAPVPVKLSPESPTTSPAPHPVRTASQPVATSPLPMPYDDSDKSKRVSMKVSETGVARNKSALNSVSSALSASGMDKSKSNRDISNSVSAILKSSAEKGYEAEKMKDPKFAMWLPPQNQSGDGKTKLNDKYGY